MPWISTTGRPCHLMQRGDLGKDEGMLFVDDSPRKQNFWMHDTPEALDIGFLGPDGMIAEIYPLLPYDERTVSSHGDQLQYALEMRQGWFAANGGASTRPSSVSSDGPGGRGPPDQAFGISLSVRRTTTGVFVFTQSSTSLKKRAGTFSSASPTVFAGESAPLFDAL